MSLLSVSVQATPAAIYLQGLGQPDYMSVPRPSQVECEPFKLVEYQVLSWKRAQALICQGQSLSQNELEDKSRELRIRIRRSSSRKIVDGNQLMRKEAQQIYNQLYSCRYGSTQPDAIKTLKIHYQPKNSQVRFEVLEPGVPFARIDGATTNFRFAARILDGQVPFCEVDSTEIDMAISGRERQAIEDAKRYKNTTAMAYGLHYVFSTLHQSCDAAKVPLTAEDRWNPYQLVNVQTGSRCNPEYAKMAPYYQLSNDTTAKSKYRSSSHSVSYFEFLPARTDCSDFIKTSLNVAGLRIKKNGPLATSISTHGMVLWGDSPNSCFDIVEFSETESVKAGDLVISSDPTNTGMPGHVHMIDMVGDDPLGLRDVQSEADCKNLDSNKRDMSQMEVLDAGNWAGPIRIKHGSINGFEMQACLAKVRKTRLRAKRKSGNVIHVILRHRSDDPACINKNPPRLVGGSCVETCSHLEKMRQEL